MSPYFPVRFRVAYLHGDDTIFLSSYFSALILVEGMDIESLHKCALDDRRELHQFAQDGLICQVNWEQPVFFFSRPFIISSIFILLHKLFLIEFEVLHC